MLQREVTNEVRLKRVNRRKYFSVRTAKKYYLSCQQWQEKEDCGVASYDFCINTEAQCDEVN